MTWFSFSSKCAFLTLSTCPSEVSARRCSCRTKTRRAGWNEIRSAGVVTNRYTPSNHITAVTALKQLSQTRWRMMTTFQQMKNKLLERLILQSGCCRVTWCEQTAPQICSQRQILCLVLTVNTNTKWRTVCRSCLLESHHYFSHTSAVSHIQMATSYLKTLHNGVWFIMHFRNKNMNHWIFFFKVGKEAVTHRINELQ